MFLIRYILIHRDKGYDNGSKIYKSNELIEVEADSESEAKIILERYYEMKNDFYNEYIIEDLYVVPKLTKIMMMQEELDYKKYSR